MATDDLGRRFDEILADKTEGSNIHDFALRRAVASLGKSVIRLDASSTRLWRVNIALTAVMLFLALIQVCLMLRGKL
ncbi:MAG: hypothetical protein JWQ87_2903 [Candidatus Sulfotelmatobacter sp.]|nr:hypothetical protein [Candidatus Sulfotelmatobacter sp.]